MNIQQLRPVLKAVSLTEDRELTCAGLDEERLAAYADAELAGHDPASHMPDIHRHLALCPDCRRDYQEVVETLRLEKDDRWVEPSSVLAFDLSFLPPATHEPAPWSQAAARVRRYVTEIPVLMLHELQQIGRLPPGLRWRDLGPPARMRGSEAQVSSVAFQLADTEGGLEIEVTVRRVDEQHVSVDVHPRRVESRQSLAGARVALQDTGGYGLEIRTLGPDGVIRFRDVAVGRSYVLRIEWNQQAWEIPFDLDSSPPSVAQNDITC